jgi:predicted nucleotidyltransferase
MTREETIARIRLHEIELRRAGISSLSLFGSVARGEDGPESDVDLMCELAPDSAMTLIEFANVERRLERFADRPIDLVVRRAMRPRIRQRAEADMVTIF